MKQEKKSDMSVLLSYAGSRRGLTFLGLALSAVSMLLSMAPYMYLAGGQGSDRRSTKMDTGAERFQVWMDSLCLCSRRHYPVFCRLDVYTSGSFSYSF